MTINTMTQEELIASLQIKPSVIVFEKTNGELREMTCTLQEEFLPTKKKLSDSPTPKKPDLLSVWDKNAKGWRSFYFNNIREIKEESSKDFD